MILELDQNYDKNENKIKFHIGGDGVEDRGPKTCNSLARRILYKKLSGHQI